MNENVTDRLTLPSSNRFYKLDENSASPVRVAGTDEYGLPREETICALAKVEKMVDRKGNIRDVPLATGRVPSSEIEVERYEAMTRIGLIRDGWLPLGECPFTQEYKKQTGRQSLIPSKGEDACDGAPDGCKHLKPQIEIRRKKAKAEFEMQQVNAQSMTPQQIESMKASMEAMAKAMGAGLGEQLEASKNALRADQGEKDEKKK
jgi:hypothetical protein